MSVHMVKWGGQGVASIYEAHVLVSLPRAGLNGKNVTAELAIVLGRWNWTRAPF